MQISAHIEAIEEHAGALGAAAGKAGLDAAVPDCPGWDVRALLAHIGMVHRWAAAHVREGSAAVAGGRQPRPEPAPVDGLLDWFAEGHHALVAALRSAPADIDSWTFLRGAGSPLAFWARRQAHETAIHRADAEAALGSVPGYDAAFAADGLDELIRGFMGRRGGRLYADPARSVLVRPTDADGRWHLAIGPDSRTISVGGAEPADCTLSGRAADLYLLLWNRQPAGMPSVAGDQGVLELWRERANITWR